MVGSFCRTDENLGEYVISNSNSAWNITKHDPMGVGSGAGDSGVQGHHGPHSETSSGSKNHSRNTLPVLCEVLWSSIQTCQVQRRALAMTVVMPLSRTQLEQVQTQHSDPWRQQKTKPGIPRLPSFHTQPLRWELLFSLWTWWVFVCLFEPRKEELWTWTFVTYPVNWNVPIKASLFPSEGVTALSLVDRMSRSWHLWLSN